MKRYRRHELFLTLILTAIFMSFACPGCIKETKIQPKAKNGVLDLRNWDFEKDGPVELGGEWNMYWKQVAPPDGYDKPPVKSDIITIPSFWERSKFHKGDVTGTGYSSFHLKVILNKPSKNMSLYFHDIISAYDAYVNGKFLTRGGRFGITDETSIPASYHHIVDLADNGSTLDIVLNVSNFHHRHGGFEPMVLGDGKSIHEMRDDNAARQFLLFGAISIIGFYHLLLFHLRRKDRSPLYFGLLCVSIAFYTIITGDNFFSYYLTPDWEIYYKAYYLTYCTALFSLCFYFHSMFPNEYNTKALYVFIPAITAFAIFVITVKAVIFTSFRPVLDIVALTASLYGIYALVKAAVRKRKGSATILAAMLFLILSLINDILYAEAILMFAEIVPFAIISFILCQAYVISKRFTESYFEEERLAGELKEKTGMLEDQNIRLSQTILELDKKEQQLRQAQKMEVVGTLSGGIAHDLNNILGGIVGPLSLISFSLKYEEPLDAHTLAKYIIMMEESADRASDLVRQLLSLSRKQDMKIMPVDLNLVIGNVINICSKTLDKSVVVKNDASREQVFVNGDITQLEQVFLNLFVNAWHAMTIMRPIGNAQGGVLEITLKKIHADKYFINNNADAKTGVDYWKTTVSDTGVGIRGDILDRIFDPFFSTKEVGQGTGLGLLMVKNILSQHEGFIKVYSEPGKGSAFNVFLPVHHQDKILEQPEKSTLIHEGRGLILVVDDDKNIRESATAMLKRCGYDVLTASDGKMAVEIFMEKHESISAVLLDMIMPNKSGRETLMEMKQIRPDVKIVLTSGFRQDERVSETIGKGISMFISKPYTLQELSSAFYEVLNATDVK